MSKCKIGKRFIGDNQSVYFIADIAANHDGSLEKAKDLIWMAKEAGANAAKFQHFKASTIVSDHGFKNLGAQQSHQVSWKKTVYDTYADAEVPLLWTEELWKESKKANIEFFTSPYDISTVAEIDPYVTAYKVGSGDLTYHAIIKEMKKYNKPMLFATGASELQDVIEAMNLMRNYFSGLVLMQCNTNYTAEFKNFGYINLNVLDEYKRCFPDVILGLSDHTLGHSTVLGAIAKGAKVIEKHFTDNNELDGPDHNFSMNPETWREMIDRSRELELALGDGIKKIEDNEKETAVLQRRCLRINGSYPSGTRLTYDMLSALRPAPMNSIPPYLIEELVGKKLSKDVVDGMSIQESILEDA